MKKASLTFFTIGSVAFLACASGSEDSDSGDGADTATTAEEADTDTDTDTDTDADVDRDGWRLTFHPCTGNRTDALFFDDPQTGYVGCGTTTVGTGLYRTTDGGQTWDRPSTSPAGFLDTFRVNHVSRSDDGKLYIAGTGDNDARVLSADTSGSTWNLEAFLSADPQSGSSFQVGSFARTSSGFAVAESLTGTDIVYRDADGEDWQSGYGWWSDIDSSGIQLLDMMMYDDKIYGCGSRINQPPYVFLPRRDGAFGFEAIQLASGLGEYNGEMWYVHADEQGVIVGGVNQSRDVGMVYFSSADPYETSGWSVLDISSIVGDSDASWIRGVCRNTTAGVTVLVGEVTNRNDGLVFISNDGVTFRNATADIDPTLGPMHRCQIFDDGTIVVTGSGGAFAHYTP
ncbi:MAG: hypothetical protein AAFV53_14755 [Myxococcota bacterium]